MKNVLLRKKTLLRSLSVIVYLAIISFFLVRNGSSLVEGITGFAHEHKVLSIWIFLFLYLLKSVSFGLPFALLYAAVAVIYPFWPAIAINIAGIYINQQIPYFLGRSRGVLYVTQLQERFPFTSSLLRIKDTSEFLFTFTLKIIGKIPHELTNLAIGSLGIRYHTAVAATILALFPGMVSTMIIAREYTDPDSPAFIIASSVFIIIPSASFIYFLIYRRRSKSDGDTDRGE